MGCAWGALGVPLGCAWGALGVRWVPLQPQLRLIRASRLQRTLADATTACGHRDHRDHPSRPPLARLLAGSTVTLPLHCRYIARRFDSFDTFMLAVEALWAATWARLQAGEPEAEES